MSGFLTVKAETPRLTRFDWGQMHWLVDDINHQEAGLSVARMIINPSACSDRHMHHQCNEALSVLNGQCIVHMGEQALTLPAGETVFIPRDTPHAIENPASDKPVELLICYSAGTRDYIAL